MYGCTARYCKFGFGNAIFFASEALLHILKTRTSVRFFRRKNRHKINRNLCLQAKLTIKQRRVKRTENNSKNTLIAMNLHIYSYNCLKTSIQQTSLSADFMTKIYKYSKRKIDKILNGTRGKINYKFIYG